MKILTIEHEPYSSSRDFLKALLPSDKKWTKREIPSWVFRGNWNATWSLQPSAWRGKREAVKRGFLAWKDQQKPGAIKKLKTFARTQPDWMRKYIYRHIRDCIGERTLLTRFGAMADKLGLPVGEQAQSIRSPGPYLMQEGKKEWPFPGMVSQVTWFGQHHGIPTRLLDWSWNPYTAAFMAACEVKGDPKPRSLAVWALRVRGLKVVDLEEPAGHLHTFVHAQEGVFTSFGRKGDEYFLKHGEWPVLTDIALTNSKFKHNLYKLTLPTSHASELLERLYYHRVHRGRMMPSYGSVAREIIDRWKRRDKLDKNGKLPLDK